MRNKETGVGVVRYLFLVLGTVVFAAPLVWLLLTSVKDDRDLAFQGLGSLVPKVDQERMVRDPERPFYAAEVGGRQVVVRALGEDEPGLYIAVQPPAFAGRVFEFQDGSLAPVAAARPEVRLPDGTIGSNLEDLPDGSARVLDPGGKVRNVPAGKVEPVRIPGLNLDNYPAALDYLPEEAGRGLNYLRNTLAIALLSVLGTLLSSSLAAYAFARLRFRGRKLLFAILMSSMLLPGSVTLLPQFLVFRSLGFIDTLLPLWAPAFLGSAFNIFMLRQFFAGIPLEFEDAARMEGCTPLQTYWHVMLPQTRAVLAVIAIWTFIGAWNNFMGPLIYVSSPENMPLSYALQLFNSERGGEPTLRAAFAAMTLLPIVGVFLVGQRQIMDNTALGSLGGR